MEHVSEDAPLASDSRAGSQEVLVAPTGAAPTGPRNSNAYALKVAGITTLVCLLVSAQVFTAYMVFNQKQQIQGLQVTNQRLKLQMGQQRSRVLDSKPMVLPGDSMNLLHFLDDDGKVPTAPKAEPTVFSPIPETEPKVQQSNPHPGVEEELQDFMDFELPHFNHSFLANLQALKEQTNGTSWKSFESWLRYWLLFQMAQKAPTPHPASGAMTKCQIEASTAVRRGLLGSVRPQCDEQGNYKTMQCWPATGQCWCVDESGTPIEGSNIRGRPDCDKILRLSRTSGGPMLMPGLMDMPDEISKE